MLHLVGRTEHKGSALLTVVMDIDEGQDSLRVVGFAAFYQLFHGSDLRLEDVIHIV